MAKTLKVKTLLPEKESEISFERFEDFTQTVMAVSKRK